MFTRPFLLALLERAAKTAAQAVGGLLVAMIAAGGPIDWVALLSTAGLITLASVLTTIGSGVATGGNASLATGSEVTRPIEQEDVDA